MPMIHIMNEQIQNQIAAGEVVDRPASVVKELVENSIDAESTIIEVVVEDGGLNKIRVTDNGMGMDQEDTTLAFERHATSKLIRERDIFRIRTLGFRGEALPSIAAVSKIEIKTWDGKDEAGTKIIMEGGEVIEKSDAPLRQGTIIEVKDLFYNTPARYKYLRTIHTELGHISDYMNRLALAHPSISFTLRHHHRELLVTNGKGQLQAIVASIYGQHTAKQMLPIKSSHIDFELKGLISKPEITRSNRQHMSIFINGRLIKHQGMIQAVLRAYHTLLPIKRFPIIILSITMDPSLLDVNVHPSKLEVRLSKENEVIEWLEMELAQVLGKQTFIPEPSLMSQNQNKNHIQPQLSLQLPQRNPKVDREQEIENEIDHPRSSVQRIEMVRETAPKPSFQKQSAIHDRSEQQDGQEPLQSVSDHRNTNDAPQIPLLFPLAQLHGTYILAQNEDGLYMIDQHAAQERIWYEHFYEQLDKPNRINQELLIPITLEFTAAEFTLITENRSLLEKMGLFLEEFGHHSYMIRSYPQWFPQGEEERLIRDLIESMTHQKGKPLDWIHFREEAAIMMACKQAIKANRYLSKNEMEMLLEQLRGSSNPFTCPHGRPITVLLTKYDIEKMFKRVM